MGKLRAIWMRLLRARQAKLDFAAELESHLQMHIEDGLRAGLSEDQARRQALIRLGGAEQARQAYRERAGLPVVDSFMQDLRYALRGFRRNPVFVLTAITTLALGIGATTAVLSVVDRILFRSLPYAHPDQLVSVGVTAPIIPQEFMLGGWYEDWREHQKPFAAQTSQTGAGACDLTERNPAHLSCVNVEANFLPALGVSPILGRNFLPEEDRPNGPKAALISYGLWNGHYNRDPAIVNRFIDIDGSQVRVVGVLPSDFEMPTLEQADVLMPQAVDWADVHKSQPERVIYGFARLKPGVTITQAEEQLQPVFDYAMSQVPPRFRSEVHLRVRALRDRQMQDAKQAAWILLGAVIAVLLIACANVASLLLTRATARERELAVRSALGATRRRLIRQALVESLLLSLLGSAVGFGLAEALLRVFIAIAPSGLPFLHNAQLDGRIAGFTVLLALACGVVFGLIPASHEPRSLALTARRHPAGMRAWLRKIMVTGQIAVSLILLAGASLLVRSFAGLENQQLGMRTSGVITASISLNRYRYPKPEAQMQFFLAAESTVRKLPGVDAVGLSDSVPPGGFRRDHIYSIMAVQGRPPMTGGTEGMVAWRWVTPEYFKALEIPILRGRSFTDEDRASKQHLLILSSLLAARMFPAQDPIGQQIKPTPLEAYYTVVGVAADVKNSGLATDLEPEYYQLRRDNPDDWQQPAPSAALVVKTNLPPRALAQWIRIQVGAIDPTVPVEVETLSERVSRLADRPRFETALLGFFAAIGLLMAVVGLYGVIACMAVQRTQEIGIRMALGAGRTDILRLILSEGLRLVAAGSLAGLVAALALSRVLRSVLFHVGPYDPVSYIAVAVLLALVALAATLIPARTAMKTDPMAALRVD
jgi:predicted permease